MRLLETLEALAKKYSSPKFSLFHVSSSGEYRLLVATTKPQPVAARFKAEALKPETEGLEVRANGIRVEFDA